MRKVRADHLTDRAARRWRRAVPALLVAAIALAFASADGEPLVKGEPAGPDVIQDDSFLVEEAYNQEPGVIQHIGLLQRDRRTGDWLFTFTDEWPAHGVEHQVSATVNVASLDAGGGRETGLGDVALNYRYQAVGDGEAAVAVAPRASLLVPTGDWRKARGNGGPGLQVMFPVSTVLSPRFVTHSNLGATWAPWGKTTEGSSRTTALNVGQSVVWLAHPNVNLMFEASYTVAEVRAGGTTTTQQLLLLSPGIRGAVNTSFGLQIVPGLAFPFGFGPSAGGRQVLVYLSFEHPVTRNPW